MRQTCPPAPLLTWARDFPAVPPQAREARLFLAALLGGRRDADEAVLCLSELVGNACPAQPVPGAGGPVHRPGLGARRAAPG